jgi:hypothetical protein
MTDTRDPMDGRLRDYGSRWRKSMPPPAGLEPALLGRHPVRRPGPHRGWWFVPLAAAVAVAAVIVGVKVGGTDSVTPSRHPQPITSPGGVVPWAPLPATHPRIPATTIPASPDPAVASTAPLCRVESLHVDRSLGGGLGTTYLTVRLTLVHGAPCRVQGFPAIQTLDHGQPVNIPLRNSQDSSDYRDPVLVTRRRPAMLRLSWSNWCTTPVSNDTIRASLPDDGGVLTFAGYGRSPLCQGDPGDGASPLRVEPFRPEHSRPERVRSAYAGVDAAPPVDLQAQPGEDVTFTVTLTSHLRLVLAPCPDYTIFVGPKQQRFGLNCAAVPHHDAAGRPYLPAGTPVRFAIQTTAGDPGVAKVGWQLEVPDNTVTIGGQLCVTPPDSNNCNALHTQAHQ